MKPMKKNWIVEDLSCTMASIEGERLSLNHPVLYVEITLAKKIASF